MVKEIAGHKTISTVKKYAEEMLPGEKLADFEKRCKPVEVKEIEGNALIAAGIDILWSLACGGAGTHFGAANAVLSVYAGGSWVNGVLTGGYPTTGGGTGAAIWKASWSGASGDGAWTQWKVTNGTQALNTKSEALGTKSGGTWTLEVTITIT